MTCTPASLVAAAICYAQELSRDDLSAIQVYLACAWANAMDPDALAFITAAGITDSDQKAAVNKLVLDLKNTGTPSYWSRDILIYPFVGGTAVAHAVNLKNPGTNDLTFGSAISHGPRGILGTMVDANSWANTGYVAAAPLTKDNTRAFWYLDADGNTARFYFGEMNGTGWIRCGRNSGVSGPVSGCINILPDLNMGLNGTSLLGAWLLQRRVAGSQDFANRDLAITSVAGASTALPTAPTTLCLLTANVGPTAFSPNSSLNARMSAFSLGTSFSGDAEWQEYRGIWETFQTALSRNIP